jgi:hypothetical protein
MVALVALCGTAIATAQVLSSANLGCTVVAAGGMACNGISVADAKPEGKLARLFVTHFTLQPGAAVDQPSSSSDCLLVGINGGDLLNEKAPFLHVSLERDSVTFMPREQPFRLRNKSGDDVEFRLIEIRR